MILKIEELKDICTAILPAVESSNISTLSETLQLEVLDNTLVLSVTNKEYYVETKLKVSTDENLFATVNANQFLKLVSQTTTDTIKITTDDKVLVYEGNGKYKLPLIYEGDHILRLPKIVVNNITTQFQVEGNLLDSILKYNLKQLSIGSIKKPVQKLFYVDEKGAITFTSGACVNTFNLTQPVKLLLNQRLVKLFKLFKDKKVEFSLGHDAITESMIQTKVRFKTDDICIDAILAFDDTLFNSVPVSLIRERASKMYPYSAVVSKDDLINALGRIKLFISDTAYHIKFEFSKDGVTVSDITGENKEDIKYSNQIESLESEPYVAYVNILEFEAILDTCTEKYLTVNFGDGEAFALVRGDVTNVICEEKFN